MTVTFIFRDQLNNGFSIEEVFRGIINTLPNEIYVNTFHYNQKKSLWQNILNIRSIKTDVYHITGDVNFLSMFLPRRKILLTIHDIGYFKNLKGWRKLLYGWLWVRLPLNSAAKITCVSKYTRDDIDHFFPSSCRKIKILPNPVPDIFRYMPLQFNTENPVILQVGTGAHKNLPILFAAIAGIKCKLSIIGPLNIELLSLLEKFNINFENYVNLTHEEVYQQYLRCDLVSFVTTHEGFGMPVLEAQAVGRPIVTSNVCSLPEVTNNTSAVIEDPMDVAAVRAAILKIIHDPEYRAQLITAGLENVKRYDINKIVQEYVRIYQSVLS